MARIHDDITKLIGNTPLVRINRITDGAKAAVLAKLEWYRSGGEVSDRQWRDVVDVLKVQGDRLDHGYLRRWAEGLKVADLLERAIREALP